MKKLRLWFIITVIFIAVLLLSPRIFNLFSNKTPLSGYTFSQAFYSDGLSLLRLKLSADDKYRLFVPLKDISPTMKKAVLLYEDKAFYYHYGVNPAALIRGFWVSYVKKTRRMGASTISMQTARMVYGLNSSTIGGKLKQILYALWLEFRYTKNQIFETYLNLAPYSYNIEGVGAASLIYFNSRVQEITLLEALTLAVIPQNPNERNPSQPKGFANMAKARQILFEKWIKQYPQDKDKQNFFNMPMTVKKPSDLPFLAPHAVTSLYLRMNDPEIFTAINLNLQRAFEDRVKLYISKHKEKGLNNAAVILLNWQTMEMRAVVGSADFWDDAISGQVNGVEAQRLVASTLKPALYGLAVQQGLIHPATLLKDTKKNFGIYSPENADRHFVGPVLASDALIRSRNIPAIELLTQTGYDNFVNLLKKGGIKGLKSGGYYATGLALGSFEASPKEIAGIYAALANRGIYRQPKLIKNAADLPEETILTPEAAFLALDMLKNNQRNESPIRGALTKEYPIYFKTGTSSEFKDAWTAGVFGDYVLVVWVGNFNGEPNNYFAGRRAALPLFFELIKTAEKEIPSFTPRPLSAEGLNLVETDVCAPTGDLPGRWCPSTFKSYFIPGVSPIKVSDVHRRVLIDNATGLRACKYDKNTTHTEIYEFWPADIELLFKQAGIVLRTVPRYVEGCTIEDTFSSGNPPSVVYPTKDVIYSFTDEDSDREMIPLYADADADVTKLFWFINDNFIGTAQKGQTLFIKPVNGTFTVKVADDLGRSALSRVTMAVEHDRN